MSDDPNYFDKWLAATLSKLDSNSFVPGMPAEQYFAAPGINSSILKHQTPKEMRFEAEKESKDTYATVLGTALHKAILEPDKFDTRDGVEEYFQYSPTKGIDTKAAKAAQLAYPEKPLVNEDIIEKARRMRDELFHHDLIKSLLKVKHDAELTGFAWNEESQCIQKVRIDFYPTGEKANYLIDVKTCEDVRESAFYWTVRKRAYHLSAALQLDTTALIEGKKPRPLYYLAAVTGPKGENQSPTDEPYIANCFEIATGEGELSLVDEGRVLYKERLAMFCNAARENHWEAYEHQPAVYLKSERPFST